MKKIVIFIFLLITFPYSLRAEVNNAENVKKISRERIESFTKCAAVFEINRIFAEGLSKDELAEKFDLSKKLMGRAAKVYFFAFAETKEKVDRLYESEFKSAYAPYYEDYMATHPKKSSNKKGEIILSPSNESAEFVLYDIKSQTDRCLRNVDVAIKTLEKAYNY